MPIRRCSRCGTTNTMDVNAERGQDQAVLSLCPDCWGKFIVEYHPEIHHKQTRNMYRVIDEEDIPST